MYGVTERDGLHGAFVGEDITKLEMRYGIDPERRFRFFIRDGPLLQINDRFEIRISLIALDHAPNAVGTIGEIRIDNPSRNVIPGDLSFTVDVRSSESKILDSLHAVIQSAVAEIATRRKVNIDLKQIWRKEPTVFNTALVDAVEAAAKEMGYSYRRITSGAGHDACNLATVIPAAMIFVPCKDGISHNELEDATQADCAAGANVLMHTVLALAGVAS